MIRTKVYASGTSNPSKVHWEAIQTCTRRMADRHTDIRIQYDAIGSGPGREEYINKGDYYKGEKVCASFIDYGRETYMSLYLLSER